MVKRDKKHVVLDLPQDEKHVPSNVRILRTPEQVEDARYHALAEFNRLPHAEFADAAYVQAQRDRLAN